ncbi:MAG: hypothetical protein RIS85_845, partial [Pseudomonadota bacterium]
ADGQGIQIEGDSDLSDTVFGWVRPVDGVDAGMILRVHSADNGWLMLERALSNRMTAGMRAIVREGCDHTLATCAARFGNAVNFQGEPFLPGNDLLTRYPSAQG